MKTQGATTLSRSLNPDAEQQITIKLNVRHVLLVNALFEQGYHGSSPTQVVARLFDSACMSEAERRKAKEKGVIP